MKEKIIKIICGMVLLTCSICGNLHAQEMQEGPDMRPLVSIDVKGIKNKTDQPRANFSALIDRLNHELVQTGIYRVMNEEDFEKTLKDEEKWVVGTDDGGLPTAISTPAFFIRMAITTYGVSTERANDLYNGGARHREIGKVELILTLVDARTAVTVASKNVSGSAIANVTAGFVETKTGNYKEQALQAACKAVCEKIVKALVQLTPFYVLSIEGNQVMTDIPPSVGKIGALYDVFKQGKPIKNKRTGKILRSEKRIGMIQLISLSEDFSTGKIVESSGGSVSDDCILKPAVRVIQKQPPPPPSAAPF